MTEISTSIGTRSTTRTGTVPGVLPRNRHRLAAVTSVGLSAGLALTGCGAGNGSGPSETAEPSTPTETVTETVSPSATVSSTETPSGSPSGSESGGPSVGPTQTYTSESGIFTWTFPETWTASQEEYSEDALDYVGVPYEVVVFQDPEETVEYRTTTGVGPTDNDGPKADVVEVLETEELPEVPVNEAEGAVGSGPVWYRASLYQTNEDLPNPESFEGGEFLLSVQVVNIDEDLDPEATDHSHWSSWFYGQPAVDGNSEGPATFLSGSVTQDSAEAVTGLEGEEAMRAFLATEEYGQLKSVATSMEVDTP